MLHFLVFGEPRFLLVKKNFHETIVSFEKQPKVKISETEGQLIYCNLLQSSKQMGKKALNQQKGLRLIIYKRFQMIIILYYMNHAFYQLMNDHLIHFQYLELLLHFHSQLMLLNRKII